MNRPKRSKKMLMGLAAGGIITMVTVSMKLFNESQNEDKTSITSLLTSDKENENIDCKDIKDYYQSFYCSLRKTSLVIEEEFKNYKQIKNNYFK